MPVRHLAPACLLALSACATPNLEIQPRYAQLGISGDVGISSGGVGGAADLEEAGLDDEEGTFAGRVDLKFGSPHLIGLVQAPSFSGSGTLDVTVSDGTNTITAGAAVDSEVELEMYDLALVFDLFPGDIAEIAIGVGAAFIDGSFRFEEQGTGTTIAADGQFPMPLLAAAGSVWLGPVEIAGFAGAMDLTLDDDSVRFIDADLFARLKLFGLHELLRTSIVLGYRWTDFEAEFEDDSEDVDADVVIQGPYLGLEFSL